ncbi:hypothetical protein [Geomesophilobacter sediminis]|uniref:O-antigen ligase-related domain-containing protein n=1 Tax=Geomesophilobacter sediminis TaxID=2798584 RepID=A0A8J7JKW5_9BACT|nr:hypothetical protein [Geomesophilobacter sediminis]MBJ6724250.1 hypothetical protein [Geomesophilobacter sediminis]
MIRCALAILFIFITYEGFFLFPESIRIPVKGVFRLKDAIFLISPLFLLFSLQHVIRSVSEDKEARLILAGVLLIVFNPLMAQMYFGQPYLTGLMGYRHSLFYLLFFVLGAMIRDEPDLVRFCRTMAVLVFAYLVLLVLTRSDPHLGIIHYDQNWYERDSLVRYGGRRMFFPFGMVYILFYFIALADYTSTGGPRSGFQRYFLPLFHLNFARSVLLTGTRIFIFLLPMASLLAVWNSRRRWFIMAGLALTLAVSQGISLARSGGNWEATKLGQLFSATPSIEKETGRSMQNRICFENFLKSPVLGVGSLIDSKSPSGDLQKYGFFNCPDIGFGKIAAEYGVLGLLWVLWLFVHVFKKTGAIIREGGGQGGYSVTVARGLRYFYVMLALSLFNLNHFHAFDSIPVIALSLVLLRTAGKGAPPGPELPVPARQLKTRARAGAAILDTERA